MPKFFALVDAQAGKERDVKEALKHRNDVNGVADAQEGASDLLIAFERPSFDVVDDFLQTHIRSISGVMGVEVVTDWADHGAAVQAARSQLEGGLGPRR